MSTLYLDKFPEETLYHIFDYLDVKTHFHRICQIIPFEQVVSLTLSNKDKTHGQIQLFLSLFNINQFTRLRSLTLIQIDDNDLKVLLNSINRHSSLNFLSIDSQTLSLRKNTALNILASTIENHSLQKLDLNMWPKDMIELQWPYNCTINYLRIRNSITLNQFYLILQYSPCLQTIILKDFNINDTDENNFTPTKFLQLKSLTCEGGRIQMNKIEECLSFTPELIYLKLIGNGINSSFDGYHWEKFIEKNLSLLKKFEFFISFLTHVNFDTSYIEEIISFYKTPFWIDEKQWFVKCDYIISSHKIMLYSVPICKNYAEYYSNENKVSASNFNKNLIIMMDNIKQLNMDLSKIMKIDEKERDNNLLFRNVTELTLGIDGEWPKGSLRFLSTTIDLLHITKLSLSINFFHEYMPSIIHSVNKLLKYAFNIHTLSLFDYWAPDNCTTNMETVRAMIVPNIKHLQIRVKNSDDIKFIIENLEQLRSITFEYAQSLIFSRGEFIDCLSEIKRHSSRWECQYALHVWLDHN